MKKLEMKKILIDECKKLNEFLNENPILKARYIGWVKHELMLETKILFPKDLYKSNYELTNSLDYTNIINQTKAIDYIIKNLNSKIDIIEIIKIHQILCDKTDVQGGAFRQKETILGKLNICPPKPQFIPYKLDDIVNNLQNPAVCPFKIAIQAHYDIVATQAFNDFNKRVARLIMNWILLQNKMYPVIFNKKSDNTNYRAAIKDYKIYYCEFMLSSTLRTTQEISKILGLGCR